MADDDGWDFDAGDADDGAASLAASLKSPGAASPPPNMTFRTSMNTLRQAVRRASASEINVELPLGLPSSSEEVDEEEDYEDWREVVTELQACFKQHAANKDDSQGLFAAQLAAFEAGVKEVESESDLVDVLEGTVRNTLELARHLLSRCSGTESELLAAISKLEERRTRYSELKKENSSRQRETRRLESRLTAAQHSVAAANLRAERADREKELHRLEAEQLKEQLADTTAQLEELAAHVPEQQTQVKAVTLRGATLRQKLDQEAARVSSDVAALTAELEALELSPRPETPAYHSTNDEDTSASEVEGGGAHELASQPRGQVLAANAALQKALLTLLDAPNTASTQMTIDDRLRLEHAARLRATAALEQALQDSDSLQRALKTALE